LTTPIYDFDETNESTDENVELLSVSEALRINFGTIRVSGMIISMSKLYKMISKIKFYCDHCKNLKEIEFERPATRVSKADCRCNTCDKPAYVIADYVYVSAVNVELQDIDSFNDIDRLNVILFDKDTENVNVGERVIITGDIVIRNIRYIFFPFLYATCIKYEKKETVELVDSDIQAIEKFGKKLGPCVVDQLIKMFDPAIIGYDHVKEGLLLCAVNTGSDNNNVKSNLYRERINALLIGDPGLAKSRLLRSVTKIVPNSRYESGENSSGKSLTAIVTKEDENFVLRLGPAALAKGAICAINEFGRMNYSDQDHLLSIMEEGYFTVNKHGINASIQAPTTIIASANPTTGEWKDEERIQVSEIPALGQVIDRFDLIFVFRKVNNIETIKEYATKKSEFEGKILPQYTQFLVKYIEYARKLNPKITDEAKSTFVDYFISLKSKGLGTNRILETLFRLAKARARLKLKPLVEEDDAKSTMQFYNVFLEQLQQVISVPTSPKDLTYNECISDLKEIKTPITLDELIKNVTEKNDHIKAYLCFGNKPLRMRDNKKIRDVYTKLLANANVRRIQDKPAVLQWSEEISDASTVSNEDDDISKPTCDLCDPYDHSKNKIEVFKSNKDFPQSIGEETDHQNLGSQESHKSQQSEMSTLNSELAKNSLTTLIEDLYTCYYCEFIAQDKPTYERHVLTSHKGKLCYPNKASLIKNGIEPRGKTWE
jgi:replicative DNA helicase Mcm